MAWGEAMKVPFWRDAVTVYHRETRSEGGRSVTSWRRTGYRGCFWGCERRGILSGNAVTSADEHVVRIPLPAVLGVGDVCVLGEVAEELCDNRGASELLTKYAGRAFTVRSVAVNDAPFNPIPHIRATMRNS